MVNVTSSSAISKKFPKWKSYASILKKGSSEVHRKELPTIKSLKLTIVFQTDEELLELNKQALGHDYYTDILTFEIERDSNSLEGELYISLDRAKENALFYKDTLRNELARLAIHGMLHLAGYDDKSPAGKREMRRKEKEFLSLVIDS
jgi:probable rRNA maturation factor